MPDYLIIGTLFGFAHNYHILLLVMNIGMNFNIQLNFTVIITNNL